MLVETEETPTTAQNLHRVKDKLEEWGMKANCMAEDKSDEGLKESMRLTHCQSEYDKSVEQLVKKMK